MGLDVFVGWLAMNAATASKAEFKALKAPFDDLNRILAKAGLQPHLEPIDLPAAQQFEAAMWGYDGLHTVRRLAAYQVLENRLPTADERNVDSLGDPVLETFYDVHDAYADQVRRARSWTGKKLGEVPGGRPRFQHLMWHSDCEGFYVPQPFLDVVADRSWPRRRSIGGSVGSAMALLEECRELAGLLDLPPDVPDEQLAAAAQDPPPDGAPWTQFGVEAYCLSQLMRACERSIATGAAVFFC